jgi:cobalt/nickel transport system permease protein
MDARVKIIFTLAFLLCLNASSNGAWAAYILFCTLLIVELILSRLTVRIVLLRSLISLPFVLAALPLLFTGPDPHTRLNTWLVISQPGLIRLISIAIKSWSSVLAAILLTCTTSFQDLLNGFRQLGLPRIMVAIISLMWRYLSLMIDEASNLMRARNSRSGLLEKDRRFRSTLWLRMSVTGKMTGNLLLRSLERSERVYAAMSARGYNGELLQSKNRTISHKELFLVIIGSLLPIGLLGFALLLH